MHEWQYEQAQQREEQERAAGIEAVQRNSKKYTPFMLDGEACCPECLEPLAAHRIEFGICVRCRSEIEQREQHGRV